MLQLLQLRGNVPLGVYRGLFPGPVVGNQPGLGLGHLDIVAKYLIGGDFHVFDAGLLLGFHLHVDDVAVGVGEQGAQLVHLGVVARADKIPLPHGEGQGLILLVPEGAVQHSAQLGQVVQLPQQLLQEGGGAVREEVPDMGQPAQPGGQGGQVPAAGGAVDHSSGQPLQVGDLPEGQR